MRFFNFIFNTAFSAALYANTTQNGLKSQSSVLILADEFPLVGRKTPVVLSLQGTVRFQLMGRFTNIFGHPTYGPLAY